MEIVYYFDNTKGYSPVKRYLEQFTVNESDNERLQKWKLNMTWQLDDKILSTLKTDGRPAPPTSVSLHGYSLIEIKNRKNKNILIRIIYFRFKEQIVLLHAFEKSDNYDTTKERRGVIKEYDIAESNRLKFINKPNAYEKY